MYSVKMAYEGVDTNTNYNTYIGPFDWTPMPVYFIGAKVMEGHVIGMVQCWMLNVVLN